MKTNYRRQHNNKRRFSQIALVLLIGVLLVLGLSSLGMLTGMVRVSYTNVASVASGVGTLTQTTIDQFSPKSNLIRENQELRVEVQELYIATLYNKTLETENVDLRELLSASIVESGDAADGSEALARIVTYRDIPYGTLLAKVESSEAVTNGSTAHFGKWAIGKVVHISGRTILIKLFTNSGSTFDVLVGESVGTFIGTSNGTGKIMLPRTETVEVGTPVALPLAGGLIIGLVEDILRSEEESLQTLLVRTPVNINSLKFINISNE